MAETCGAGCGIVCGCASQVRDALLHVDSAVATFGRRHIRSHAQLSGMADKLRSPADMPVRRPPVPPFLCLLPRTLFCCFVRAVRVSGRVCYGRRYAGGADPAAREHIQGAQCGAAQQHLARPAGLPPTPPPTHTTPFSHRKADGSCLHTWCALLCTSHTHTRHTTTVMCGMRVARFL